MRDPRAYPALLVAVVCVSFASIFIRWSESHALVKATYRMGLATLALAPLALGRFRHELRALSRRDGAILAGVGLALGIHFATWIWSLDFTSVASSVILVNAHPLLVALLSHLVLEERVSRRSAAGILLGLSGILVIATGDVGVGDGLLGDALALAGGSMTAVYLLAGRRLRQRIPLVPYVFVVYAVSTGVLASLSLAFGAGLAPSGDVGRELALFVGLALVSTLLGHTLYNWTLRHLPAPVVSTSLLGEPVGASLLALAFLAEVPRLAVVLGGAVALVGIYLAAAARTRGRAAA